MKKLFLLALFVFFAGSGFAHNYPIHFAGITLHPVISEKGTDIYQTTFKEGNSSLTLSVCEENMNDLDMILWSDLNERDEEGTYRQVRELTYNKTTPGVQDAYLTRSFYIVNDSNEPDAAFFQVKRFKQNGDTATFYTLTFKQVLDGPDVQFEDFYGNKKSLPPADYFEYVVRMGEQMWIHEMNHLILPVFNK